MNSTLELKLCLLIQIILSKLQKFTKKLKGNYSSNVIDKK